VAVVIETGSEGQLMKMMAVAALGLIPTLAFADLGDTRNSLHKWPADWLVSHRYGGTGKAIVASYSKLEGAVFSDSEITEILHANGMPTEVWKYYAQKDGSLLVDEGRDENLGAVLWFKNSDLGVRSLTVASVIEGNDQ
jgi:hypothetical protein